MLNITTKDYEILNDTFTYENGVISIQVQFYELDTERAVKQERVQYKFNTVLYEDEIVCYQLNDVYIIYTSEPAPVPSEESTAITNIPATKNQGETEEFIFFNYAEYTAVPDFFTEEQQNIYKEALTLYDVSRSSDVLDMERFFPLKEGQEYIAPNEGEWVPDFITDDGSMYAKTIGRYRKWEDFQRLITSVFTREAFDELNEHNTFIEIDGDLYILGATGMPYFGYSPKIQADTFNLISSSENEIKFTVTGYFYDSEDNYVSEITTHEIILTKTTSGWRFSKFDVVWM